MSIRRRRFTIYLATCVPTGQGYIGVTYRTPQKRFQQLVNAAKSGPKSRKRNSLQRAIRKFGPECFEIRSLQKCYSRDRAHELECWHIRAKGTLRPHGFNGNGGGPVGLAERATTKEVKQAARSLVFARRLLDKRRGRT
jgi:hypothetical protein